MEVEFQWQRHLRNPGICQGYPGFSYISIGLYIIPKGSNRFHIGFSDLGMFDRIWAYVQHSRAISGSHVLRFDAFSCKMYPCLEIPTPRYPKAFSSGGVSTVLSLS